jgi:hypothetical protein
MKKIALLLLFPIFLSALGEPVVEYRFDECYWMDGANGVTGDAK